MKQFSDAALAQFEDKRVESYSELKIGDNEVTPINYNYSFDASFGAAVLSFELLDKDLPTINYNNRVILWEGVVVDGTPEKAKKFTGLIRQINRRNVGGQKVVSVTAFDDIIKLQDLEIVKEFEASKIEIVDEELIPNYLPAPNENLAQVFDAKPIIDQSFEETDTLSWLVDYTADALPDASEPVWTKYGIGGSVAGGILTLNLTKEMSYYHRTDGLADNSIGNTVGIRYKAVTGGQGVSIYDGAREAILIVSPTAVWVKDKSSYDMDTTDAFYTYQMSLKNNIIKVYIDGTERISCSATVNTWDREIDFGVDKYTPIIIGGDLPTTNGQYDYVKYGVGVNEVVLSTDSIAIDSASNVNSQVFRLSKDTKCLGVELYCYRDGDEAPSDPLLIEIKANGGDNKPAGDVLCSLEIPPFNTGSTNKILWKAGKFSSPVSFSKDTPYHMVVSSDCGATNRYKWVFNNNLGYADGWVVIDGVVDAVKTFFFRVYEETEKTDWAYNPLPSIVLRNRNDERKEPMWEGYEIGYQNGQVILGTPINTDDYQLLCSYFYYPDGLHAEDVIEDILIEKDGYENEVFTTADNLTETFSNVTGNTVDTMTPNYLAETIEGVEYAVGRIWYLSFNNLISTPELSDFTVPGANAVSFDKRLGRLILDAPIFITSTVTYNKDYVFKTIQSSGIELTYFNFTAQNTQNRFDAIQNIKQLVAPNYLIRTKGDDKIWATYVNQKYTEDYEPQMLTSLSTAQDEEVYTRVRLFGKNINPLNLMLDEDVTFIDTGLEYTGYAYEQELVFTGGLSPVDITAGQTYNQSSYRITSGMADKAFDNNPETEWNTAADRIENSWISCQWETGKIIKKIRVLNHNARHCKLEGSNDGNSWHKIPANGWGGAGATQYNIDEFQLSEIWPPRKWQWVTFDNSTAYTYYRILFYDNWHGRLVTIMEIEMMEAPELAGYEWVPEEDDQYYFYYTGISSAGKILHDPLPVVHINDIPIDNEPHEIYCSKILVHGSMATEVESGKKGGSADTYYSYTVHFAHSDIMEEKEINVYGSTGEIFRTLPPHSNEVDYGRGIWHVPGTHRQLDVEELTSATYWVNYSDEKLQIDYENAIFKIHKSLISKEFRKDLVTATFKFQEVISSVGDIHKLHDGRWTTQTQAVFFAQPLKGIQFAIIDLGSIQEIDTIDMVGGFYYPDLESNIRRFDVTNWYTLNYSLDNVTYYSLCAEANNFELGAGESISFERDDLPDGFRARYLKIVLENSEKVDYGDYGRWVVAIAELAIYKNVVLSSEAKLVSTKEEEDDTHLYDYQGLLTTIGDKIYKDPSISEYLDTQTRIDNRSLDLLKEFVKNVTRGAVEIMYAPMIELGDTEKIDGTNYFVEGVRNVGGRMSLTLARYPGLYGE